MECNPLHYAAFTDRLYALRGRLFLHAGGPWEGETSDLKAGLIQAMNRWEELTGGGVPCPLEFDAKDLDETAVLDKELSEATWGFEFLQSQGGVGEEGWVPTEDYEGAVAFFKEWKEKALAKAESAEEREEIEAHWPWDDMDRGDVYVTICARYFALLYLIWNLYIWAGRPRSSNCGCRKRLTEERAVSYMRPCRSWHAQQWRCSLPYIMRIDKKLDDRPSAWTGTRL